MGTMRDERGQSIALWEGPDHVLSEANESFMRRRGADDFGSPARELYADDLLRPVVDLIESVWRSREAATVTWASGRITAVYAELPNRGTACVVTVHSAPGMDGRDETHVSAETYQPTGIEGD